MLSFLLLFARIFPENILKSPRAYNSSIGLGGFLEMLAARCQSLSIHTNAAVSKVEEVAGSWFIETRGERHGPYEKIIVNAPPYASRKFMSTLPAELLDLLGKHEYYSVRIVIHRDAQVISRFQRPNGIDLLQQSSNMGWVPGLKDSAPASTERSCPPFWMITVSALPPSSGRDSKSSIAHSESQK
jgi:predicted NAD/FAD-dependent oxidoreductase